METSQTIRRRGRKPATITLTGTAREHLIRVVRAATSPQRDVLRARIVLYAADGLSNGEIAAKVGCNIDTVGQWRSRFAKHRVKGLRDQPRAGAPTIYTAEHRARVIQFATETTPQEHGVPVSHWDTKILTEKAREAGIDASRSSIHRWLVHADLKPHLMRYWLNSPDKEVDPEEFNKCVADITEVYGKALERGEEGSVTLSIDEKTGIQAISRIREDKPMRPGSPLRREYEYKRNGTQCLTAAFNVASGEVHGLITSNRPAIVFQQFLESMLEMHADAPQIHIVCDKLNTHMSHEACQSVAAFCGIGYDPKAHPTMPDRREFLICTDKRVIFHYTPRHASWLNQIEIWFSVVSRKLLNRGCFVSTDALALALYDYMEYHNAVWAHPYKWTYTGAVCCA